MTTRYETPGERLSRRFWSLVTVVVILAALNTYGRPIAVAVVLGILAGLFVRLVVRSTRRAQYRAR